MNPLGKALRRTVSSHICRVSLPWVNDGSEAFRRFRRHVTYRVPRPPWYLMPLIPIVWMSLCAIQGFRLVRVSGRVIHQREGIHPLRQYGHLLYRSLRRNVTAFNYYEYQVYRRPLFDGEDEFIASSEMRLYYDIFYDKNVADVLDDKALFFDFCRKNGLSTVPILYEATGKGSAASRAGVSLPRRNLFSKPRNHFLGYGTLLWTHEADIDRWRCRGGAECEQCGSTNNCWACGGEAVTAEELLNHLEHVAARKGGGGSSRHTQILQPQIANHAAIKGLSLTSLNTARMITVCRKGGEARLELAQLRMPIDDSIIDTCKLIAASIDLATGRLGRAVSPNPQSADCDVHPATGNRIEGTIMPDWEEAKELVLKAHRAGPALPIIGWDVAFTPDGPVLIEANTCGQVGYCQVSERRSLATPEFVDALLSWLPPMDGEKVRSGAKQPSPKAAVRAEG